jgi:hypothetical protein
MGRDFASEEENVEKRRCFEKRDYDNCGPIRGLEYCMREIVHLCEIRTGHCRGIT